MNNKLDTYLKLSKIFEENGYFINLVGGTVRDYLLGKELDDMDAVTNATPEQMRFFIDADFTFAKFGSVKYKIDSVNFDITTLRKEKRYKDSRHPSKVKFVESLKTDHKRRDFTINGLYLNKDLEIIDYCGGIVDINRRVIRTIGRANKRFIEDPLRIFRAIRFMVTYDFVLETKTEKSILKNAYLLDEINKDKIKAELRKCKNISKEKLKEVFVRYGLNACLNVLD